jgi:hypothetical protein
LFDATQLVKNTNDLPDVTALPVTDKRPEHGAKLILPTIVAGVWSLFRTRSEILRESENVLGRGAKHGQ